MPIRSPKVHRVKSWIHLFQPALRGDKTHDIRILDRDYEVGDTLVLQEYDKQQEKYTGRHAVFDITYITSGEHVACAFSPVALKSGYGVLSIKQSAYGVDEGVRDIGTLQGKVGGDTTIFGGPTPVPDGETRVVPSVFGGEGLF